MARNNELIAHHHKAVRENNQLRLDLKSVRHELNALKAAWKAKRAQDEGVLQDWEMRLADHKTKNVQLEEEIDSLREKLKILESLEQEVLELRRKNEMDERKILQASSRVQELQERNDRLSTRNMNLREELKSQEDEYDKALRSYGLTVISNYKGALAVLEQQVEELTERNVGLVEERHLLQREIYTLKDQASKHKNYHVEGVPGIIEGFIFSVLQRCSNVSGGPAATSPSIQPNTMFQVPQSFWDLMTSMADDCDKDNEVQERKSSQCIVQPDTMECERELSSPDLSPSSRGTSCLKRQLHASFENEIHGSAVKQDGRNTKIIKLSECCG